MEAELTRQDMIEDLKNTYLGLKKELRETQNYELTTAMLNTARCIEYLEAQEHSFLWEENKRMHREIEFLAKQRHDLMDEINESCQRKSRWIVVSDWPEHLKEI